MQMEDFAKTLFRAKKIDDFEKSEWIHFGGFDFVLIADPNDLELEDVRAVDIDDFYGSVEFTDALSEAGFSWMRVIYGTDGCFNTPVELIQEDFLGIPSLVETIMEKQVAAWKEGNTLYAETDGRKNLIDKAD